MEPDILKVKRYYYDRKLVPNKDCPKCGNKFWSLGGTLLSWMCPMCGTVVSSNVKTAIKTIDSGSTKCPCN